jgi:hypothetical protein
MRLASWAAGVIWRNHWPKKPHSGRNRPSSQASGMPPNHTPIIPSPKRWVTIRLTMNSTAVVQATWMAASHPLRKMTRLGQHGDLVVYQLGHSYFPPCRNMGPRSIVLADDNAERFQLTLDRQGGLWHICIEIQSAIDRKRERTAR